MWQQKAVKVIPIVVSVPGLIQSTMKRDFDEPQILWKAHAEIQKALILDTCRIVRKAIDRAQLRRKFALK